MKIAIIGAKGFAGGYLDGFFRKRGEQVVPILRDTVVPEDGFDVVIDCNGDARRFWANENPEESYRASVLSVRHWLETLRYDVYVYLSTIDVYGENKSRREHNHEDASIFTDTLDTYGSHKYLAEQAVAADAQNHLILRLGSLIGKGLKKNPVFDAINNLPIRQTGNSTLSLLSLDQLGRALNCLLEQKARGTFNITGSETISITDICGMVFEILGRHEDAFAASHNDLLHTDYDISVDKISRYLNIPASGTMLRDYLEGLRSPGNGVAPD